jgi:hypothetical protein
MIKAIAIIVAVLLAGILIFAATRPDTFRVQRSTSIKAPPEKIFPLINDLQRWGAWWDGNKSVGKGRMAMYGPASFVSKLIGIFFSMDSMIGKDFEAGLAALKTIAEK